MFKNRYLKYKTKYLNLKNKTGGGQYSAKIFLVTINSEYKQKLVLSSYGDIFTNEQLREEEINIMDINFESESIYKEAKYKNYFSNELLVSLYDNIGAMFICTEYINNKWNLLANKIGINIAIFNGDNNSFKNIACTKYIEGINILAGCSTKDLAKGLNKELNSEGKKFVGFDKYKHNYGDIFYNCEKSMKLSITEFITQYESFEEELPIIRIIKIFYNNFHNEDNRECSILTLEKIEEKLKILKNKEKLYNNKDYYFNSAYQIKCENNYNCNCLNNYNIFESYIKNKYILGEINENKIKEIAEKEKLIKSQHNYNKFCLLNKLNDGDDITNFYKDFFDIEHLKNKIFNYDKFTLQNDFLVSRTHKIKIFVKKNNGLIYYEIHEFDKDNNNIETLDVDEYLDYIEEDIEYDNYYSDDFENNNNDLED